MPEQLPPARFCQSCGGYLVERYLPGEGRPRLCCELCGHVHYLNPRVVAAAIVEHGGRVLLQQRAIEPRAGFWTFPGGFLEMGETPEQVENRLFLCDVTARTLHQGMALLGIRTPERL